MKRVGLLTAWLALAALVTTATWRVVGAAENQVGSNPLAPVVALTLPPASDAVSTSGNSVTTGPANTAPTTSGTVVSTSVPASGSSTTVTAPPTTAATAPTTSASSGVTTIPSPGGTVTVSRSGSQVSLEAAGPAIGFTAEIDHAGPDEVRVEFESELSKVTIRARVEDGQLVTEVSVSGDE